MKIAKLISKMFLVITYPFLIVAVMILFFARGPVGPVSLADESKTETPEIKNSILSALQDVTVGNITAKSITIVDEDGKPRITLDTFKSGDMDLARINIRDGKTLPLVSLCSITKPHHSGGSLTLTGSVPLKAKLKDENPIFSGSIPITELSISTGTINPWDSSIDFKWIDFKTIRDFDQSSESHESKDLMALWLNRNETCLNYNLFEELPSIEYTYTSAEQNEERSKIWSNTPLDESLNEEELNEKLAEFKPNTIFETVEYNFLPKFYGLPKITTFADVQLEILNRIMSGEQALSSKLKSNSFNGVLSSDKFHIWVDTIAQPSWDVYLGEGRFDVSDREVRVAYEEAAKGITDTILLCFPEIDKTKIEISFTIRGFDVGTYKEGKMILAGEENGTD